MYEVDTKALRVCMAEAGILSITELAKKSGVSRGTVTNVMQGKIYPSSKVIEKLVMTLGIAPQRAGGIFFKPKLT